MGANLLTANLSRLALPYGHSRDVMASSPPADVKNIKDVTACLSSPEMCLRELQLANTPSVLHAASTTGPWCCSRTTTLLSLALSNKIMFPAHERTVKLRNANKVAISKRATNAYLS